MKKFVFDRYGKLVQEEPGGNLDGGDSLNWSSHLLCLNKPHKDNAKEHVKFFHNGKWGFCRHPLNRETHAHYKNPWNGNISRDQMIGILSVLIEYRMYWEMLKFVLHHACWGFLFAYNTVKNNDLLYRWKWPDLTIFDIWALELRGFGLLSWALWPILNVLDLWMLLSTIIYNYVPSKDPISFRRKLMTCQNNYPTIISSISFYIVDKKKLNIETAAYWCGWRKQPGMYELEVNKLGG